MRNDWSPSRSSWHTRGAAELNDQTIEHWRDYIRPSAQELSFLEIPWRDSFNAAVKEALKTDQPILLWAMNGHPLGCT